MSELLRLADRGRYSAAGAFSIDPWPPVDRSLIIHARGDHARWGPHRYLAVRQGEQILPTRLGPDAMIETLPFGETIQVNGVTGSLRPAGHILTESSFEVPIYRLAPQATVFATVE